MSNDEYKPRVSIIIPCYNHGKYIDDAVQSIDQIADKNLYEVIIVNDGSTDELTNERLRALGETGLYKVIFQKNQGLATSRNNAIALSKGEYILPLDADNKIRPEYVYKGIEIMDSRKDVSIVYGNAAYFGDKTEVFRPGPFNLQKLMIANYIDACAIYRKTVWEVTGGYDKNMPSQGVEDWEMWMHACFKGFKFHYQDEILYDYRVLADSMIRQLKSHKIKNDALTDYIINKHPAYFGPQYIDEDIMQKFSVSNIGFVGKLILKKYFPSKFEDMVRKGKLRRYI